MLQAARLVASEYAMLATEKLHVRMVRDQLRRRLEVAWACEGADATTVDESFDDLFQNLITDATAGL